MYLKIYNLSNVFFFKSHLNREAHTHPFVIVKMYKFHLNLLTGIQAVDFFLKFQSFVYLCIKFYLNTFNKLN